MTQLRDFSASRLVTRHPVILGLAAGTLILGIALGAGDALAQAKNPFNVGISEGGSAPPQGGITGWIFAQQIAFERMLSGAVRAIKADTHAIWALLGISFAYGVFHAAGPGHGKAVVASYMLANERALKRGIIISFLAAMLQGLVAITIVGVLAWLLNATSQHMKSVANFVEVASFGGIALLGLWLMWRKGGAFIAAIRDWRSSKATAASASGGHSHAHDHDHGHKHNHADHHAHAPQQASDHAHGSKAHQPPLAVAHHDHAHHDHAHHDHPGHAHHGHAHHDHGHTSKQGHTGQHPAHAHDAPGHVHDEHCGHFHAPDPKTLGDNFSWGGALATIVTAGARPCSGAILVLVFALAQGIFLAGVAATFAMALGTALTTGALAAVAVLAKSVAVRFAGGSGGGGTLFVRTLECAAAVAVFLLGAGLFMGSLHA
jgi:nickel/cobalt exporter